MQNLNQTQCDSNKRSFVAQIYVLVLEKNGVYLEILD